MCFYAHNCLHMKNSTKEESKALEVDLNSLDIIHDNQEEANVPSYAVCDANGIVDDQPRSPGVLDDSKPKKFDSTPDNIDLELPMSEKENIKDTIDSKVAYCGPFSPFGSNSICCNAIPTPNITSVAGLIENKTTQESTSPFAITDSAKGVLSDSVAPEPPGGQFKTGLDADRSRISISSSSSHYDNVNDFSQRRKSDVSIVVSDTAMSRPDSNYRESSSIIYEDDVLSIASTVFSASGDVERVAETPKNALETPTRTPSSLSMTDDSGSELMSPISPRSKRMAFKRKSLTASEQDKQLVSPVEERLEHEPARARSLRINNPPATVAMRHFSPR